MQEALGLIETKGLVAALEAADAAAKAARVRLLGIKKTVPALMTVQVVGETAAVRSAVDAGRAAAERVGSVVSTHVIPRPDEAVARMQSVAGSCGNIVYYDAVMKMRDEVSTGTQLNVSMRDTGLFPNMVVQMIAVGEESGSLDEMSSKVADFYEEEVDNAVDSMSSLLEPLIMSILGVLVGGLVKEAVSRASLAGRGCTWPSDARA